MVDESSSGTTVLGALPIILGIDKYSSESVSKAAELVTNFLIAGACDGTLQTVEIGDLEPRQVGDERTLRPWIKVTNDLETVYYGEDDGTDITLGLIDASVTSFAMADFAEKKASAMRICSSMTSMSWQTWRQSTAEKFLTYF